MLLTVVTWTVALSAYAHGLTAWPGANRDADWYAAHATDHAAMPESAPAAEQRLRAPPAAGLIPLTCYEVQHLFAALVIRSCADLGHRLRWSAWRRRHQHRARTCHYQRQATQQP